MEILARDSNERGDLFSRLVADLFAAQGYESPRMNIHKTGREIDLKARHRLEPKQAIAECKATKEPTGGDELNKFAGVLQAETLATPDLQSQGYFVSLSGYRESAREQEAELGSARFVLLDGRDVQDQLISGKMVVARERVVEIAGRLANPDGELQLAGEPRLLAHKIGWIWLCVYERDHKPVRFALVHADSRPLDRELAEEVVAADAANDGGLAGLEYCPPEAGDDEAALEEADRRYREYLSAELGQITLEGLPADEEVGAKRIALEELYVPLDLVAVSGDAGDPEEDLDQIEWGEEDVIWEPSEDWEDPDDELFDFDELDEGEGEIRERMSVGALLGSHRRIAILAAPGAGKSTLIKRLAVAYATGSRQDQISDDLPDADWLPVFLRCRALRSSAREPIRELLDEIPRRGEFPEHEEGFSALLTQALSSGRALLLIDGLDEIADPGDRISFVVQLRTFLATYPNVRVVLTSRETGFRIVAGAMSSMCEKYRLAEFEDEDIERLTRAWHATVVGESDEIDRDARKLAGKIVENPRVRALARNPLLLTTLLLVKRWVGELPPKRTILYEKAIEVLLMTWNVEAHEPVDREEAVPQLAYVAHDLIRRGVQSVSATELGRLLGEAREEMPEVLGFAQTSAAEFVDRIESRSSLLVMTGHVVESGKLVPSYEFRHLTFQEYLAAEALVEGFYAGHDDDDRLADLLAERLWSATWSEVIGLALVRAGRSAGDAVRTILDEVRESITPEDPDEPERPPIQMPALLLARALSDEVQMPPGLVEEVCVELSRIGSLRDLGTTRAILDSRYGKVMTEVCEREYLTTDEEASVGFVRAFADFVRAEQGDAIIDSAEDRARVQALLDSSDEARQARGALLAMRAGYLAARPHNRRPKEVDSAMIEALHPWSARLIELCRVGRAPVQYAATWALAWLGSLEAVASGDRGPGLAALLPIWRDSRTPALQKQAAWAFAAMPRLPRGEMPFDGDDATLVRFAEEQAESGYDPYREDRRPAGLLLAFCLGKPWSPEEILKRIEEMSEGRTSRIFTRVAAATETDAAEAASD